MTNGSVIQSPDGRYQDEELTVMDEEQKEKIATTLRSRNDIHYKKCF